MGFWDEIEEISAALADEKTNKYIGNPEEGFKLISGLLSFNHEKSRFIRNMLSFNNLVDNGMLEIMGSIGLEREVEVFNKLNLLKDKMSEQKKIKLLNNKCVVGLGGKFSAGKSRFINSIINDNILPEDQTPTTSIPTYITNGEERLSAYTFNDMEVSLDREAIEALTHAFHKKYKLGFSHIIRNILIQSSSLLYKNVVLLDTPGYTKADGNVLEAASDEFVAKAHLKTVDFLIWLVDIENGVIVNKDIEFIKSLGMEKPILIVFNKADKVDEDTRKAVLKNSRRILSNTQLNIYDVTAYSSRDNVEYYSDSIRRFFLEANEFKNKNEDIRYQLNDVKSIYTGHFENRNKELFNEKRSLENIIFKLENIGQLNTLVRLYSANNGYISKNNIYKGKFERVYRNVEKIITDLVNNE